VADLPSEFWGGWIVAITVVSFISLLWLIIDVYRGGPGGNEHLVWDETLREGAKPAPIWWFWFILALMTISVVYVILYPGLALTAAHSDGRWVEGSRSDSSITKGNWHAAQASPQAAARRDRRQRHGHALRLARLQQQLQFLPRAQCRRPGRAFRT
jgi:hypothetical protein